MIEICVFQKQNAQDEDGEMVEGLDGLDAQESSDHNVNGGDHLFSGDLSHMHQGKGLFSVNNKATTQHYSMHSAKVVWGFQVLRLHEECTILEPEMTCQAPYLLVKNTTTIDQPPDDHICLFLYKALIQGHMSDRGLDSIKVMWRFVIGLITQTLETGNEGTLASEHLPWILVKDPSTTPRSEPRSRQ